MVNHDAHSLTTQTPLLDGGVIFYYYVNMLNKLIIGKVNFDPALEKRQHVQILLDSNNELPSADSLTVLSEEFGHNLDIGKVFYENDSEKFYFASIPEESQENLPDKWGFVLVENLTPEKYTDYEIILKAIEELGYEPIAHEEKIA